MTSAPQEKGNESLVAFARNDSELGWEKRSAPFW